MKITIHTHPNSSQEKIKKIDDFVYKVYLHANPVNNKANIALKKILSKYFKVALSDISILKGNHSKIKILDIRN